MLQIVLILALIAILVACSSAWGAAGEDEFFPVLPWDGLFGWTKVEGFGDAVESIAGCNFTVAGFVQPEQVSECEKLGLKAIIAPTLEGQAWKKWGDVPDDEIDPLIAKWIKGAGDSSAILGYFIMDEPGTPKFRQARQGGCRRQEIRAGQAGLHQPVSQLRDRGRTGQVAARHGQLHRVSGAVRHRGQAAVPQLRQLHGRVFGRPAGAGDRRPSTTPTCWRSAGSRRSTACRSGTSSPATRSGRRRPSPRRPIWRSRPTPRLAAGGRGVSWYKYFQGGYAYAPDGQARATRRETWHYLQARQPADHGPSARS